MQQIEAENARLCTKGLGALSQLKQASRTHTHNREKSLPSLVATIGIGQVGYLLCECDVKFESFVVGVYGEDMRAIFEWTSEQEADVTEHDVHAKPGLAADTVDQVDDVLKKQEALDVVRNAPVGRIGKVAPIAEHIKVKTQPREGNFSRCSTVCCREVNAERMRGTKMKMGISKNCRSQSHGDNGEHGPGPAIMCRTRQLWEHCQSAAEAAAGSNHRADDPMDMRQRQG
eukprot:5540349-Amphidinium_carterae.1